MTKIRVTLFTGLVVLIAACSNADMKRTGYETLQNIRQQECYKNPSVECENRESLEVYEDRREGVKQAE